jgi:hypothetical protein
MAADVVRRAVEAITALPATPAAEEVVIRAAVADTPAVAAADIPVVEVATEDTAKNWRRCEQRLYASNV